MPIKLTIGMATYDDFHGVYFSVQALRLYHPEVMRDTEIVIVDNNPDSKHGEALREAIGWWFGRTPEALEREGRSPDNATLGGFQYIPYKEVQGTSAPRDLIFRKARGEFVLVMDSHVLLAPRSLKKLLDWRHSHPEYALDLLSGPLTYDGLDTYSTHFDDVWREQMWGTWASAWACRCGQLVSPQQTHDNTVVFTAIRINPNVLKRCPTCKLHYPEGLSWIRHEDALKRLGFRQAAEVDDFPAFSIPAQGLGLFGCAKSAWLGFNPLFRGFGGEEHYIHEKFRQAGRQNLCLPFLKWVHRFGRVGQAAPYPHSVWNKVRNYVIGHAELGLPLDRVKSHFVNTGLVPTHEWEQLVANPLNPPEMPVQPSKVAQPPQPPIVGGGENSNVSDPRDFLLFGQSKQHELDIWFYRLKTYPHDFRGHEDTLRKLASEAENVTELGGRRGSSTVCLLAGQPKRLRVIDPERGNEWDDLMRLRGRTELIHSPLRSEKAEPAISTTDLLVIDTNHHATQLTMELERYAPFTTQRIVIHDTVLHAHQGEGGQPGLLIALRQFLEQHPEWFIAEHDARHYGLTTLSRLEADRLAERIILWKLEKGPGTELKILLASLNINPSVSCDCNAKAVQMDAWGVEGCKRQRDIIVGWLREGQGKWGWKDKLAAAARAVTSGLALHLNPLDPLSGIVDEAIRRAEMKEKEKNP